MRPGTWDGAVSTDNVRVTVNGTVRPARGVRIQSGMRDGHPQSDTGASWCVEATIEWIAPPLVFSGAPHAFGGGATEWLPKAGDTVVIETGDGALGQWWVQHRGMIDDTTGSFADGTAKSTTVDRIDDLDAAVQFGALLSKMTPAGDGFPFRRMGMQSTFLIDRTLRSVQGDTGQGWYATPPRTWQTVGSVPGQGSLWPEVGSLITCRHKQSSTSGPAWSKTSYGVCPSTFEADYRLTSAASTPVLTLSLEATFGSDRNEVYLRDGDGGYGVFLGKDHATGNITYGTLTPGRTTFTLPIGSATRAAIYYKKTISETRPASVLTIRTDDGREVTKDVWSTGWPLLWAADRVAVDAPTGQLGWWMVENDKPASQRWMTLDHVPTARIRVGDMPWWSATRDMPFTNAAQWLGEQVDAECSAMWLDEDGVMQWAGRGVLDGQYYRNTITSVRDVDDIQWESRRRSLARSVWLNYTDPQVSMNLIGSRAQTCWSTGNVDVPPGTANGETENVTVPGEQDWVSVDLNPHNPAATGTLDAHLTGSIYGGTQYRATDADEQTWALFCGSTMTRNGLRNFQINFWAWDSMSSAYRVKTTFPKLKNAFMAVLLGDELALRCRAITTWVDGERSANAGSVGPARYTHDVDWRVQSVGSEDGLGDLLTFLKTAVSQSHRPRVTGLTIAHDPRHQVGDKIRIQDTAITGVDFDLLIQQRDVDTDAMTETISGRVTVVRIDAPNGPATTDWTSRLEPGGHTPITPESDWTRKAV